jgi:hypothetical protein
VTGPPEPVDVDMSWYMGEGPGRYYHPGMFPIMHQIIGNRKLPPGVYDLEKLAADEKALKARISHYGLDMRSVDFPLRALVFGNESAKISGQVTVNNDGSKTFKKLRSSRLIPILISSTILGTPSWRGLVKSPDETTIRKTMVVDMRFNIVVVGISMSRILIEE